MAFLIYRRDSGRNSDSLNAGGGTRGHLSPRQLLTPDTLGLDILAQRLGTPEGFMARSVIFHIQ